MLEGCYQQQRSKHSLVKTFAGGCVIVEQVKISQVESIEASIDELAELLMLVVHDGASIGFLPPLPRSDAEDYWRSV